jgi:hypothetical protein
MPTSKFDHRRTVSWDDVHLKTAPIDPRNVSNLSDSVAEYSGSTCSNHHHPLFDPRNNHVDIVTLASMQKNPLESEVEHHILSSIEDQDHLNEEPEILSSVPDTAMNVFQFESVDGVSIMSHPSIQSKQVALSTDGSVTSGWTQAKMRPKNPKFNRKNARRRQSVDQMLHSVTKSIAGLQGIQNLPFLEDKIDKTHLEDPNAGSGGLYKIVLANF